MNRFILIITISFFTLTANAQGFGNLLKAAANMAIDKATEKIENKIENKMMSDICKISYQNADKDTSYLYFNKVRKECEGQYYKDVLCDYYSMCIKSGDKKSRYLFSLSPDPEYPYPDQFSTYENCFYGIRSDRRESKIFIFQSVDQETKELIPESAKDIYLTCYLLIGDTVYKRYYNSDKEYSDEYKLSKTEKGEPYLLIANNQVTEINNNNILYDYEGDDKFEIALLVFSTDYYTDGKRKIELIKKAKEEKIIKDKNEYEKFVKTTKFKKSIPCVKTVKHYECRHCYHKWSTLDLHYTDPSFAGLKDKDFYIKAYTEWKNVSWMMCKLYIDNINGAENKCKESHSGEHAWQLIKTEEDTTPVIFQLPREE